MSTRAIASATGTDDRTVRRDLSAGAANAAPDGAPGPVTGRDGKQYAPQQQPTPPVDEDSTSDDDDDDDEPAPAPEPTEEDLDRFAYMRKVDIYFDATKCVVEIYKIGQARPNLREMMSAELAMLIELTQGYKDSLDGVRDDEKSRQGS